MHLGACGINYCYLKLQREREYSKRRFIFQEAASINTCVENCSVWKTHVANWRIKARAYLVYYV